MFCEVKQSLRVQVMDAIFLFVPFDLLIYKSISHRADHHIIVMSKGFIRAVQNDKLGPLGTESLEYLDFQSMLLKR